MVKIVFIQYEFLHTFLFYFNLIVEMVHWLALWLRSLWVAGSNPALVSAVAS